MYTTNSFGFTALSHQEPVDTPDQTQLQGQQSSYAEKPLKNPTMAPLGSYGLHHGPIAVPNPRPPNPRPAPKPQPAPTPVSHTQPVYLPNPRPPNPRPAPKPQPAPKPVSHTQPTSFPNPHPPNSRPAPKPQPAPTPVSHTQPTSFPNPRPPNPRPAPKPQPAPKPASHSQPASTIWTAPQIRTRAEAELTQAKRAIQEVVAREFNIPTPALIRINFRLSPADIDDNGKWSFFEGRLWNETGRSIWAPTLVIWLPERTVPEGKTRALRDIHGPSSADRETLAKATRVEKAVRRGEGFERYEESSRRVLEGKLPVRPDGELVHCGLEFRYGLMDIYPLTAWPTVMYLPVANWQITIPVYERVMVRGESGKARLTSWAEKWKIKLPEQDQLLT